MLNRCCWTDGATRQKGNPYDRQGVNFDVDKCMSHNINDGKDLGDDIDHGRHT